MAWIQLLLFSFLLAVTPLTTLCRSVHGDLPDNDSESTFKSIYEAIQMELSSCNQRLSEKMEYSFNIEKDLSVLKEQMMLIRTLYLNSSYTSSLQTTDLKKQLKEARTDLEAMHETLSKCQTANNSQILQIVSLQQRTDELNKTEDSISSPLMLELEDQLKNISVLEKNNTELEDQLKQKEKELSDLNEKNADVTSENERLRGDVRKLNNRVKALEKSEQQLRQKEEEVSELKRENAKLLAEKQNLQEDVTKLTDQLNDLRKAPVTTSPSVSINSLQFDPNTAHRRLLISDDRQSVRGVRYSIVRPDDPRRYDTTIAALAGTGFTGGRPYWDVQVKDRSCFTVGVAAESAPRKGEIYFRPSNRYWVIQKKNSQIYVLTEQPFQLTDQLNIIGVLIDFFQGEVAFYNSETRTVLGIFRGNHFTEKLYPFVATCGQEGPEDWPIELLDTGFPKWLPN